MVDSQTTSQTAEPDEVRAQVHAQQAARVRAQVREEVRAEAWAQMRAKFRFLIAGLALVSMAVGGLIGHYGFGGSPGRLAPGMTPSAGWGAPERLEGSTAATAPAVTRTPWGLRVYVSGAVAAPQVVDLPPGSLVVDALDAAGGPAPDADLEALNLAAPVADHQQLQVPHKATNGSEKPDTAPESMTPVAINSATAAELATLPYIGETRANAIIAYREANGPFTCTEDIMKVPGIGPTIFARIAELITVEP